MLAHSAGWLMLVTAAPSFALALGISSLLGSRGTSIGILLGWQLVAMPLLVQFGALVSSVRDSSRQLRTGSRPRPWSRAVSPCRCPSEPRRRALRLDGPAARGRCLEDLHSRCLIAAQGEGPLEDRIQGVGCDPCRRLRCRLLRAYLPRHRLVRGRRRRRRARHRSRLRRSLRNHPDDGAARPAPRPRAEDRRSPTGLARDPRAGRRSAIASDSQDLVPALIILPGSGSCRASSCQGGVLQKRRRSAAGTLLAITLIAAVPLVAYALDMGAQARDLEGPPHHVQRLSTMAAMALSIVLIGLLAALRTRGWRIPAWSAGTAAIVFGLASVVFPDNRAPWGVDGEAWPSREVSCLSPWPNGRSEGRRPLVSRA